METPEDVLSEVDNFEAEFGDSENTKNEKTYKIEYVWPMILIMGYLHIGALHGLYLVFTSAKIATTLFALFLYQITIWGLTAGVHRLWSHRAFKAKWPLRLLLLIMSTTAYQNSVIHWAREHRTHHKFGDTNADPHNPKRGFFFAHIGWALCRKHPDVIAKGAGIDMSDLYNDPLVKFQHKHRTVLMWLCCFILPTIIPMYFWHESFGNAFLVAAALRWTFTLNVVGLVNSASHMYGSKPYDKNTSGVENITTALLTSGEAWHNYHHAFPWDYKASELGRYWCNSTIAFIDFMAWIGWAYDLKTASPDLIRQRAQRTGDGSHEVWGWTDKDMTEEDKKAAIVITRKKLGSNKHNYM